MGGMIFIKSMHVFDCLGLCRWGCARGFGRGTLYMKWGQENQRFAKMRLGGEKMKKRNMKKKRNIMKYDKM